MIRKQMPYSSMLFYLFILFRCFSLCFFFFVICVRARACLNGFLALDYIIIIQFHYWVIKNENGTAKITTTTTTTPTAAAVTAAPIHDCTSYNKMTSEKLWKLHNLYINKNSEWWFLCVTNAINFYRYFWENFRQNLEETKKCKTNHK